MTASLDQIERRRKTAIDAICRTHGTADDEYGVTLFVSHHLEEIGDDFWLKHCGVARPDAREVLDILVLQSYWGCDDDGEPNDDGIDTFDFTLPDEVTNYVLCVKFDENGNVSRVSMES